MVAINRLTVRGIAGLADGNHSDGGNLYLRKKGQRASWVFRYKLRGRVKELGLGSYPSRSLSEARKVAAELRTQLLDGLPVRSLKSQRQDMDVPTLRKAPLHTSKRSVQSGPTRSMLSSGLTRLRRMFSLKSAITCRQKSTYQPLSPSYSLSGLKRQKLQRASGKDWKRS